MVRLPGNPAISGTCGPYFPETFRSPTLRHVLFYHLLYGRFELREFSLSIPFLLQYAPHVHRRLQPGPLLDSPPFSGIRGVRIGRCPAPLGLDASVILVQGPDVDMGPLRNHTLLALGSGRYIRLKGTEIQRCVDSEFWFQSGKHKDPSPVH